MGEVQRFQKMHIYMLSSGRSALIQPRTIIQNLKKIEIGEIRDDDKLQNMLHFSVPHHFIPTTEKGAPCQLLVQN